MDWFLWLQVGITSVLALLVFSTVLSLLSQPRLRQNHGHPSSKSSVSILVPARNEETKIERCLRDLRAQAGIEGEILLLDDHSEDRTQALAREIAAEPGEVPLRILEGKPLPEGWGGKPWACHQLSEEAKGDRLLFVDADTEFEPEAIASALAMSEADEASLFSAWSHQVTKTWAEKLIVPLIFLLAVGVLPLWMQRWVWKSRKFATLLPKPLREPLGAANGQFMLFTREAYEELGGHEAVRDHMVEDVALGRIVIGRRPEGMKLVNANGGGLVRCRMYESTQEVIEGFSKNIRPLFEKDVFSFIGTGLITFLLHLLPFCLLPWAIVHFPEPASLLVLGSVALVILQRVLITLAYRTSWLSVLLHPFAMIGGYLIGLLSWWKSIRGTLTWKGRSYHASGGIRKD